METDDLHSGIADREASERKATCDRLAAIENEIKRRGSRGFARYLVAICIGVAATLAWQSYGEATKQIIATRAPELGWSPEAKQMIASWVQQLGWTKPSAGPENIAVRPSAPETPQAAPIAQAAPETVAPKAPTGPLHRPGAVASDGARSCRAAAKRRSAYRQSKPDGATDGPATVRPRGHIFEVARAANGTLPTRGALQILEKAREVLTNCRETLDSLGPVTFLC